MSELKQRLMIQELAKIGFHDAFYKPESDAIQIKPDENRPTVVFDNGDMLFGAEYRNFAMDTLNPLVKRVNEVIAAWENSQATTIESVSNFRILAEYNSIVLCARDDTEKGYGFHFVTWEYNQTRTAVEQGHYSTDYSGAKQDFAIRSGMIPREKIFTLEQAAEIKTAIEYRLNNDDAVTLKMEDVLDEITAKLKTAYPDVKSMLEKATPDKGVPISENDAIEEQAKGLYQQFTDKIDAEMGSYTDYIKAMDKREMFSMATDIGMREEIVWSIKNNQYEFDNDDIKYLLSREELLTEMAGELKGRTLDRMATTDEVKDVIINILTQRYELNDSSLDRNGIADGERPTANDKPDKYSILGDLKEKTKEVKPSEKQKNKDDINLS